MRRLLVVILLLVSGGLVVVQLAEWTMSRHELVDTRLQMTRSLFLTCRLEVNTSVVSDAFEVLDEDSFRFVISPALDEADQRQLHGCVEDARIDQLQTEVVRMERVAPARDAGGIAPPCPSQPRRHHGMRPTPCGGLGGLRTGESEARRSSERNRRVSGPQRPLERTQTYEVGLAGGMAFPGAARGDRCTSCSQ